jgi:hypothetical protein
MDCLASACAPLSLRQPRPAGGGTGEASRLGHAVAKALLHRRGQAGSLAGGLGHGEPRGEPSGRLGGQPAAHGMPVDAEPVGHLTPGASLRGVEAIEGLQASVFVGIARRAEKRVQCLWRFLARRQGRLHGARLRSACMSPGYRPESPPVMQYDQRELVL